ncbi:MAG: radical SAM/SPASM domain-containing protein [Syntrophorhabdales bacterium]|jgi:radical SAM protein with 4Fe4S-binding SPASM domain
MKAEIKPRIELQNRTRLEEVIPLSTPFVLFVDPSDICNFHCKFCPTGSRPPTRKRGRKPGLMDFDLYRKIIDDLGDLERPLKVLRLYKDGEPLMHPLFADMIRYAKERACALQIDTTTNGSLLNPKRNLELISAGLDRINISVNGVSRETYERFTGYRLDFDRLVDNIRHLYEHKGDCVICIKTVGDVLSEGEKERFFDIFGDIADRISIEYVAPCWPNFDMNGVSVNSEVGIYGQDIGRVEVCPYIFYSLSVNSDGTASLCFLDWSRDLIVGDVRSQTLQEIWNGEALLAHRRTHLMKRRRENAMCADCGQLSHCLPDNIDPFAEMLLPRIEGLHDRGQDGGALDAQTVESRSAPDGLR